MIKKGSLVIILVIRQIELPGKGIMGPRSKKEYTGTIFLRYKRASRKEKIIILNEFRATLGYHRKHAVRVLKKFKRFRRPQAQKRGRPPFSAQLQTRKPFKKIWLAANLLCSKRLKAILPLWISGHNQLIGPLTPEASTDPFYPGGLWRRGR